MARGFILVFLECSLIVGVASSLLACGGTERDAADATSEGFHSFTASFEEARSVLSFDLLVPTYVPAGLREPAQVQVYTSDGKSYSAALYYVAPDPSSVGEFTDLLITETASALASNFGLDEPTVIAGTVVYFSSQENQVSAEWIQSSVVVSAVLGRDKTSLSRVREELSRVIESLIRVP